MSLQIGYIDQLGHPKLRVRVTGLHPTNFIETEVMIDTGFSGFLALPLSSDIFPLGLILSSSESLVLGDGRNTANIGAFGNVTILSPFPGEEATQALKAAGLQEESVAGLVVLGIACSVVGMAFIRSLKKYLLVGGVVALIDEKDVPLPPNPVW